MGKEYDKKSFVVEIASKDGSKRRGDRNRDRDRNRGRDRDRNRGRERDRNRRRR